jgi:TRAP-type C4-dicarboxylate transport system permease small subunit
MLQMFYLDVAKLVWDVAYVAMPIHVCFICFRRILQMFHRNVSKVDRDVACHLWLAESGLPQPPVAAAGA